MPEVDYCDLWFPVERNRLFIDPVRNLVSLEQGFYLVELRHWNHDVWPRVPVRRDIEELASRRVNHSALPNAFANSNQTARPPPYCRASGWLRQGQESHPARNGDEHAGEQNGARLVPRLGWPALRTNGVLQPQLARRPLNPLVFAERSAPLDAHPHAPEFLRAQRRIHAIGPIHGAFHWPRR